MHHRHSRSIAAALLGILALTPSVPIVQAAPPIAAAQANCPAPGLSQSDLDGLLRSWQNEISQRNFDVATAQLQGILAQVKATNSPLLRIDLLTPLLLSNEPLGTDSTELMRWQQGYSEDLGRQGKADRANSTAIALVTDLGQLALQLPASRSYVKIRALSQLAEHLLSLGQTSRAQSLLQAAQASIAGVQGDIFKARALATIARVQAIAQLRPAAEANLATAAQHYLKIPAQPPIHRQQTAQLLGIAAGSLGLDAQADRWAKDMVQSGGPFGTNYIWQALLRAALRNQRPEAAQAIVPRISDPTLQVGAQSEIGQFYTRSGQRTKGQQWFEQILTKAKDPSMVSLLLQNYAYAGYPDQALARAEKLSSSDDRLRSFSTIALAFAKANQPQKAQATLNSSLKLVNGVDSSWRMAELWGWAQTVRRADQLKWVADRWNDWSQSVSDFGSAFMPDRFAVLYAQEESIAAAATWATQIRDPQSRVLAVTSLADYAYRNQQPNQGQALLTTLETQIEPLAKSWETAGQDGGYFREISYARLARAYGKNGQMPAARRSINAISQARPDLGDPAGIQYSENAYSLISEAGLFDLIFQLAQSIRFPETRSAWRQGAAIQLAQANQIEQAQTLLKETQDPIQRSQLLLAIANHYHRQGNPNATLTHLQQAQTATQSIAIAAPVTRTQYWLEIATLHQKRNDLKSTLTSLQQAQTAAQSIPGDESEFDRLGPEGGTLIPYTTDRGSMLISVAIAYIKAGQPAAAQAIVQSLKDPENRTDALRQIQETQAELRCNRPT
jgi:tetratricopeptide (TPR) repeat protein